jgi:hypothetical protein
MYVGGTDFTIGTTVSSLGTIACATGHGRTDSTVPPSALCSEGNIFLFRGCEPDVHCSGSWSRCSADCEDKLFTVTTEQSGQGAACRVAAGARLPCEAGEDECPANVDCVGSWSVCDVMCSAKAYSIARPQSGTGAACPAAGGALAACAPGEGQCPPNVDCIGDYGPCNAQCTKTYEVFIEKSGNGNSCEAATGETTACATDSPCDDDDTKSMDDTCSASGECKGVVALGGELSYPLAVDTIPDATSDPQARAELETSITTNLVTVLTVGGMTCTAADIVLTDISAGSVVIDYTVNVPPELATPEVQSSAAAALADPPEGTSMAITIGGETAAVAEVEPFKAYAWVKGAVVCADACGTAAETVVDTYTCEEDGVGVDASLCIDNQLQEPSTTTYCPPTDDCDCMGSWSVCEPDCGDKTFTITQDVIGSVGNGRQCDASDGAITLCSDGEDLCFSVDCVGAWSSLECNADCSDRVYSVSRQRILAGSECEAADGDVMVCNPGDSACPLPPAQDDPTYVPPDVDCVGSWSDCTSACEVASQRVWEQSVAPSGNGAACDQVYEPAQSCAGGEGECPRDVDCTGAWSACTVDCEVASSRSWSQATPQEGRGSPCPAATACQPGEDDCQHNINCAGKWTDCTSACETAAQRTWVEAVSPSGHGAPCPVVADACEPGVGACPLNLGCDGVSNSGLSLNPCGVCGGPADCTEAVPLRSPVRFAGDPDVETIAAAVAELLSMDPADVSLEIVSMEQEVKQEITMPGSIATFVGAAARAQLKSGLAAYLNEEVGAGAVSVADIVITGIRAGRRRRRRLQSGGVAVDYTVSSTVNIAAAFAQPDFVVDFVDAVNTAGSELPRVDPLQVEAAEPQVSTSYQMNVLVPQAEASTVSHLEPTLSQQLANEVASATGVGVATVPASTDTTATTAASGSSTNSGGAGATQPRLVVVNAEQIAAGDGADGLPGSEPTVLSSTVILSLIGIGSGVGLGFCFLFCWGMVCTKQSEPAYLHRGQPSTRMPRKTTPPQEATTILAGVYASEAIADDAMERGNLKSQQYAANPPLRDVAAHRSRAKVAPRGGHSSSSSRAGSSLAQVNAELGGFPSGGEMMRLKRPAGFEPQRHRESARAAGRPPPTSRDLERMRERAAAAAGATAGSGREGDRRRERRRKDGGGGGGGGGGGERRSKRVGI